MTSPNGSILLPDDGHSFARMLGIRLPKLETIYIVGRVATENSLLAFIAQHSATLRNVRISGTRLELGGTWSAAFRDFAAIPGLAVLRSGRRRSEARASISAFKDAFHQLLSGDLELEKLERRSLGLDRSAYDRAITLG